MEGEKQDIETQEKQRPHQLVIHPLARNLPFTERLSPHDVSMIWNRLLKQSSSLSSSKYSTEMEELEQQKVWKWIRESLPKEGLGILSLLGLRYSRSFRRDPVAEALGIEPILRVLVSFLDAESLANASCVCRQWRDISDDDEFWANLCLKR